MSQKYTLKQSILAVIINKSIKCVLLFSNLFLTPQVFNLKKIVVKQNDNLFNVI